MYPSALAFLDFEVMYTLNSNYADNSYRPAFSLSPSVKLDMTIRAFKFTPEVLLEAPRRSEGIPNTDASKVLYSVSTYSFSEHSKKSEVRILDVASQQTTLVTDDKSASEPTWLDDETIVLLKSNDDGTTSVVVGKADGFESRYILPVLGFWRWGADIFQASTQLAQSKAQ